MATPIQTPPNRARAQAAAGEVRKIGGLEIKSGARAGEESAMVSVYGKSGAGKTVLMSTVLDWKSIKTPKLLVIDADGGLRSVRGRGAGLEYTSITTFEQFLDVRKELERGAASEFGAIGLDTGSEVADLAMETTLKNQGKDEPDWLSWRDNSRLYVTQVMRPLRNIGRKYGIPVIITFWEREETSESGTVRAVHADLNPALRKLALAAVDLACWEEVLTDDKSRALHLATTRRTDSKFRLDMNLAADRSIPPHMYNPSLATIFDTIIDGKSWPEGAHSFPEGLSPRFARVSAPAVKEAPKHAGEARNRRRG